MINIPKCNEINPFIKGWRKGVKSIALVYPNRYVGGISNIGLQYIYAEINAREGYVCERFYSDVFHGQRSVETGRYLKDFDIALFSLQYEEDYFRAVKILRGFKGLKIAGGPCCMLNPKPILKFFDAFVIGEVEKSKVLDVILEARSKEDLVGVEGIYTGVEDKVKRIKPKKLDFHLKQQIISDGAYGRCILLEIGRGCIRHCRFCVVRQIYSPPRWRDVKLLFEVAENYRGVVNKVALIAPSASDHPRIKELIAGLIEMGYLVSPSSIRADTVDDELMELLKMGGLKSFTIAPEAGSERLRELLRKDISEEDIINAAQIASEKGIKSVKLYFMIGLPTEGCEDIKAIVEVVKKVKKIIPDVSVSINPLVPKPHTPFQWLPYTGINDVKKGMKMLEMKIRILKKELSKVAKLSIESVESFALQTILSRGDEDVSKLIESGRASLKVAEKFRLLKYLNEIEIDEELPWDFIDHGYKKKRLIEEYYQLYLLLEKKIK